MFEWIGHGGCMKGVGCLVIQDQWSSKCFQTKLYTGQQACGVSIQWHADSDESYIFGHVWHLWNDHKQSAEKKPALRYNKKHSPKLSTGWLGCLAKYTAFVLRGRLIWTVSVTVCMLDDSLRLRLMIRVTIGARTTSKEQSNWEFRSHPRHLLLNK